MRRRRRVVVHTIDPGAGVDLPSVEGLLLNGWLSRRVTQEYRLADVSMRFAADARPDVLADAAEVRIPLGRVFCHEVLR